MQSAFDTRGQLYIDCAECNRGGNGLDVDKCSCGWKTKKAKRGGCFVGTLMDKYKKDLELAEIAFKKKEIV